MRVGFGRSRVAGIVLALLTAARAAAQAPPPPDEAPLPDEAVLLDDPEMALRDLRGLVVLDEVQRRPDL